jgi:N-acyl-L-homoserine lactone synthetase
VAALQWRDVTVGTLRFVPLCQGLSPLDSLLAGQVDPALTRHAWEFGRLVLDPDYRSGPELVRRSIFLGVQHLSEHTDAQHVFASCTPALARLYRRYGFSVVSSGISTRGSSEAYCLIHGEVDDVLRAAADRPAALLN